MTLVFALVLQLAQQPTTPPAPVALPAQQTPAVPAATTTATPDPANSQFALDSGLMLVSIKPGLVADYELTIKVLQEALAKTTDPQRREVAKGWRVFKAQETDATGNVVYIHLLLPAVPGFDYRVSLLVDEMVKDLAPDMLSKYRDAFAKAPSKLNLVEFANMATAPLAPAVSVPVAVPVPVPVPKKPGG